MTKRTVKEKKFIKAYIDSGGNATKAYLAINPKVQVNSAGELGYRLLKKVDISMSELMDEMGIDDNMLTDKLKEGLEATKLFGITCKEVEDYASRAKYLDMALKLKAKYPAEKKKVELSGSDGGPITLREVVYKDSKEAKSKE